MKEFNFNNCNNVADIRNRIVSVLGNDVIVANEKDARSFFKEQEMEGDITTNIIFSKEVSVWNDEMNGEEIFNVVIREHFIDPGYDDYVYSFSIS